MNMWDWAHTGGNLRLPSSYDGGVVSTSGKVRPRPTSAGKERRKMSHQQQVHSSVPNLRKTLLSHSSKNLTASVSDLRDAVLGRDVDWATTPTRHSAIVTDLVTVPAAGADNSADLRLSRFEGEADEMSKLAASLREAALARNFSARAVEGIAADFERDFRPGNGQRGCASSIVVKASNVVSRLQTALSSLEGHASLCLNMAHLGAAERESMLRSLRDDAIRRDVDFDEAQRSMQRLLQIKAGERALASQQADVDTDVMRTELGRLETKLDKARAAADPVAHLLSRSRTPLVARLPMHSRARLCMHPARMQA